MKSTEFIAESVIDEAGSQEYGIRYKVFAGREGRLTTKEKWFSSAQKLENFANKVQDMGNFYEIDGYSYPQAGADALQADPLEESPADYMLHGIGGERGVDRFQKPFKLKRDGRIIGDYDTEQEALKAWQGMPDNRGVKIVRESINEGRIYHMVLNDLIESVTDYDPKSQGGTRKELLAKYKKSGSSADATAARKAGATQDELKTVKDTVAEDASAGATGSASIAAAPAQEAKKPIKRKKEEVKEGQSAAWRREMAKSRPSTVAAEKAFKDEMKRTRPATVAAEKAERDEKKKMKESVVTESSAVVGVTMVDKDSSAVSKRSEEIFKRVRVKAADRAEAIAKAKAHYAKKGYKVIDAEYLEGTESQPKQKTNEAPLDNGPANITKAIDELILAWDKRGNNPELKQRRIDARIKLETFIDSLKGQNTKEVVTQQTNEAPLDNGPGKIKAPKVNYGQSRGGPGYEKRPEELAKIKSDQAYEKEQQRLAKKARDARYAEPKKAAAPKISLDTVWMKVEDAVGRCVPDGDPIDWLIPWFNKQGIKDFRVGEILTKAARKNGYKDMYAYYDEMVEHYNEVTADYGRNQ